MGRYRFFTVPAFINIYDEEEEKMRKKTKRGLAVILSALLVGSALTGCGGGSGSGSGSDTGSSSAKTEEDTDTGSSGGGGKRLVIGTGRAVWIWPDIDEDERRSDYFWMAGGG